MELWGPYEWVTGVILGGLTPLSGVITLLISGREPILQAGSLGVPVGFDSLLGSLGGL